MGEEGTSQNGEAGRRDLVMGRWEGTVEDRQIGRHGLVVERRKV